MNSLRFNVFGRQVLVRRSGDAWQACYLGAEGKMRPAEDIVIPRDVAASDIAIYLADLCHEWATEKNPRVEKLSPKKHLPVD